jgi:hypothetical protein
VADFGADDPFRRPAAMRLTSAMVTEESSARWLVARPLRQEGDHEFSVEQVAAPRPLGQPCPVEAL